MSDLATVKFFVTPLHKCSYLPRQDAITLFADPKIHIDRALYSELSEMGFRRSGNYLYRPHCKHCQACVPVRIPCAKFEPTRGQKRIWKKNSDITVRRLPAYFNSDHYALYEKYIAAKHSDGDMFPPSPEQYESFLLSEWGNTFFYEFKLDKQLLAVAVSDEMTNGISAVYTFYDPTLPARSLGTYAILWQIAEAHRLGLPAVYLGYWIRECQKMTYKTDYQPLEMYLHNQWVQMPD